ncbi:hypothetical protein GLOTRDRAFT_139041 [Gloeophyllum trabeum ATCC 11539]|uniref:Uncharacterized protein n=1 Tax=Gloeophyllum trabeum (strain ATCC 11539 / FP-39264 / Madison 617) TaxID=670483 RepID=S7RNV1_GLOTA|nr:uncharacterized protein GLOTRDRAFT_139041 [Gloeophyllum trabeum ATCC 11539]EPQ54454.1 hypothetical protein GLOTRDRAFT_139041 [Gloeophyllum trabeum ATCC 11539]
MLMLTMLMSYFFALLAVVSAVPAPRDGTKGQIVKPSSGDTIAPGQAFDFQYNTRADYGSSSYNFTVWLVTSPATSMSPSDEWMQGHYFGRFQEANYPAVPYPTNPPPSQLVMPNLAQSPGGFGAGATAVDATFYLVVLEEWDSGDGALGAKIGLSMVPIIYNATSSN